MMKKGNKGMALLTVTLFIFVFFVLGLTLMASSQNSVEQSVMPHIINTHFYSSESAVQVAFQALSSQDDMLSYYIWRGLRNSIHAMPNNPPWGNIEQEISNRVKSGIRQGIRDAVYHGISDYLVFEGFLPGGIDQSEIITDIDDDSIEIRDMRFDILPIPSNINVRDVEIHFVLEARSGNTVSSIDVVIGLRDFVIVHSDIAGFFGSAYYQSRGERVEGRTNRIVLYDRGTQAGYDILMRALDIALEDTARRANGLRNSMLDAYHGGSASVAFIADPTIEDIDSLDRSISYLVLSTHPNNTFASIPNDVLYMGPRIELNLDEFPNLRFIEFASGGSIDSPNLPGGIRVNGLRINGRTRPAGEGSIPIAERDMPCTMIMTRGDFTWSPPNGEINLSEDWSPRADNVEFFIDGNFVLYDHYSSPDASTFFAGGGLLNDIGSGVFVVQGSMTRFGVHGGQNLSHEGMGSSEPTSIGDAYSMPQFYVAGGMELLLSALGAGVTGVPSAGGIYYGIFVSGGSTYFTQHGTIQDDGSITLQWSMQSGRVHRTEVTGLLVANRLFSDLMHDRPPHLPAIPNINPAWQVVPEGYDIDWVHPTLNGFQIGIWDNDRAMYMPNTAGLVSSSFIRALPNASGGSLRQGFNIPGYIPEGFLTFVEARNLRETTHAR